MENNLSGGVWHIEKHPNIEDALNYLVEEMKKHDKSYDGKVKDVELGKEQVDKQTMEWIKLALSDSGYPSRECKEKLKRIYEGVKHNGE